MDEFSPGGGFRPKRSERPTKNERITKIEKALDSFNERIDKLDTVGVKLLRALGIHDTEDNKGDKCDKK